MMGHGGGGHGGHHGGHGEPAYYDAWGTPFYAVFEEDEPPPRRHHVMGEGLSVGTGALLVMGLVWLAFESANKRLR